MKKAIILIGSILTLFSCKKESAEIIYKHAYILEANLLDSAKIKRINTNLHTFDHVLSVNEVNQELKEIRLKNTSDVIIDTLVLLDVNINNSLYNNLKK